MHIKTFLSVVRPCPPLRLSRYELHAAAPSYLPYLGVTLAACSWNFAAWSPACPCDLGSLCLLAGPLPPLHPCPLLLWAGFDTRLCSLSRICRLWFTRPRVGVGTSRSPSAGSLACPCDLGSLCLLAGPLPSLHPCPLLLWAGFDTRLCSLSRICRPWFTRPRVGVGASRSPGAGAVSSLFPRSALPRAGLSM